MKIVSIIPHAGLCNRMRAIASGIRIAQQSGAKANIYWNVTPDCCARFSDLFEDVMIDDVRVIENKKLMYRTRMRKYFNVPFLIQKLCNDQVIYDFDRNQKGNIFSLLNYNKRLLLCSCYIMCDYDRLETIFKPIAEIRIVLEKIVAQFSPKTIGVHIRGTDHSKARVQSPLTKFVELMDSELQKEPDTTFYLATDDPDVKVFLKHRYGERILSSPIKLNRNSLEGIRGGVIDLYALSKTNKIIGSCGSSYSEVAAELGQIELVIAR